MGSGGAITPAIFMLLVIYFQLKYHAGIAQDIYSFELRCFFPCLVVMPYPFQMAINAVSPKWLLQK